MECESLEYDDYYVLSEDSDTGEIIGIRNLYYIVKVIVIYQIQIYIVIQNFEYQECTDSFLKSRLC